MRVGHHYEIIKRRGGEHLLGRLVDRMADGIYIFDYIRSIPANIPGLWREDGPQSDRRNFNLTDYEFIPFSFESEHYW